MRAMRDGKVDSAERAHLSVLTHGLRFGMTLLLLASLGLVVVSYIQHNSLQPALTPSYWMFIALALLIITVSWSLARRHVSFGLGSAALFTAWWFLVYLSFGWLLISFGSAVMAFIVMTAIFYAILHYARIVTRG